MCPMAETDMERTVDSYLAALTEVDADRRADLIANAWAENGRLIDPPWAATGWRGVSRLGAALQVQFPGYTFRRVGDVDARGDRLQFGWRFVTPDGTTAVYGVDCAEMGRDGRLLHVRRTYGGLAPSATPRTCPTARRGGSAYFRGRPAEQWREALADQPARRSSASA